MDLAQAAGVDSIGLRVTGVDDVAQWWGKGIGSPMLRDLVATLLASRATVLDVGRVVLGPELRTMDYRHAYLRALELGVRLGAQFGTARASAGSTEDQAELFALLAGRAFPYHLRPLITVVPDSPIADRDRALEVVAGTTGGIVLDVAPSRHTAADVDEAVVELREALGYVRVPARELAVTAEPGLLATLPPQVPVAIGGAATGDPEAPAEPDDVGRVTAVRAAVDLMLRHPRAARAH